MEFQKGRSEVLKERLIDGQTEEPVPLGSEVCSAQVSLHLEERLKAVAVNEEQLADLAAGAVECLVICALGQHLQGSVAQVFLQFLIFYLVVFGGIHGSSSYADITLQALR